MVRYSRGGRSGVVAVNVGLCDAPASSPDSCGATSAANPTASAGRSPYARGIGISQRKQCGEGDSGRGLSSIDVDIPIKCVRCGAVGTTSRLIGGSGSGNFTLENVTLVGACPLCGGDMKPPDGTYEFEGGILTALSQLQPDQLRQVEHVLRRAANREIAPEEAASEVTSVAPELAAVLARLAPDKQTLVWVQTLLAAIAVILAWMALHHNTLTAADHHGLERGVRTAIEQAHAPAMPVSSPASASAVAAAPHQPSTARSRSPSPKRPSKTFGKSKRKKRR